MTEPTLAPLSAAEYHADATGDMRPSLSSSIAHVLCSQSPAHAWTAHPRLNPNYKADERATFDIGTAAHALLLQGDASVAVTDAPDWRTKDAREFREGARAAGQVPLLRHQLDDVVAMVGAAQDNLAAVRPPMFSDGAAELTLTWEERGVLCRARLDWLRDDRATIDDYKTTGKSASPESWERAIYPTGGDIQAALYIRGVRALTGHTPTFRWLVQENYPPYALAIVSPGADVLALADAKVDYALDVWQRCLDSHVWPGYEQPVGGLHYASLPPWEEARWLARGAEASA